MKKTIFNAIIIDDEKKVRINLKTLIAEYCPEIQILETFSNPKTALSWLLRNQVDLLFVDVVMPEMDGFELIENLKKTES